MTGRGGPWPLVIAGGAAAAVHIWKVPPFVTEISERFGTSLVDAGFLLSLIQLGGLLGGVAVGFLAESIGFRRCFVSGLAILAVASVGGAFASEFWMLLVLRAIESIGFVFVVVSGPGIIPRIAPVQRRSLASAAWGTYMGIAAFGTLTLTWVFAGVASQSGTWLVAGAVSAIAAIVMVVWIPRDQPRGVTNDAGLRESLLHTVRTGGVWIAGVVFMAYASTWIAVLGFLPTILGDAGVDAGLASFLTGVASGVNMIGNLAAGFLLQRGVPARLLLSIGAATMGGASIVVFALGLPPAGQFIAVLVFSSVAGLIPGTLFPVALAITPARGSSTTAVGILLQCTNAGMFFGPPLLAAITTATGTWSSSWWFTVVAAGLALVLAQFLGSRRQGYRLGT